MHFMSFTHAFCIPIIGFSEHFKTLVYKNVMHYEIGRTIHHNTKANRQASPKTFVAPEIKATHAYHCVKNKKGIIALKPTVVIFVVVVFVQAPQKPMHDVFMGEPSHKFHDKKGR
jgi:hypothetical protein